MDQPPPSPQHLLYDPLAKTWLNLPYKAYHPSGHEAAFASYTDREFFLTVATTMGMCNTQLFNITMWVIQQQWAYEAARPVSIHLYEGRDPLSEWAYQLEVALSQVRTIQNHVCDWVLDDDNREQEYCRICTKQRPLYRRPY